MEVFTQQQIVDSCFDSNHLFAQTVHILSDIGKGLDIYDNFYVVRKSLSIFWLLMDCLGFPNMLKYSSLHVLMFSSIQWIFVEYEKKKKIIYFICGPLTRKGSNCHKQKCLKQFWLTHQFGGKWFKDWNVGFYI